MEENGEGVGMEGGERGRGVNGRRKDGKGRDARRAEEKDWGWKRERRRSWEGRRGEGMVC